MISEQGEGNVPGRWDQVPTARTLRRPPQGQRQTSSPKVRAWRVAQSRRGRFGFGAAAEGGWLDSGAELSIDGAMPVCLRFMSVRPTSSWRARRGARVQR